MAFVLAVFVRLLLSTPHILYFCDALLCQGTGDLLKLGRESIRFA